MKQGDKTISLAWARLYIILTAVGWSMMGVAFKFVTWNPLVIGCVRSFIVVLLSFCMLRSIRLKINRTNLIGAIINVVATNTFIAANQLTTAGNAILLQYTNPIFVLLIGALVLKQKLRKKDLAMMAVVLLGMLLFFVDDLGGGNASGNLIALTSGLFMGLGILYARHCGIDIIDYQVLSHFITFIIGIPFCFASPPQFGPSSVGAVVFMAIFSITIPMFLYRRGVKALPAVETSMLLMLDPVLNPILVALFVGEVPGALALLGGGLVLISIGVWSFASTRQPAATLPEQPPS